MLIPVLDRKNNVNRVVVTLNTNVPFLFRFVQYSVQIEVADDVVVVVI